MDINLSNCPFCGGDAKLVHRQKGKVDGSIIECAVCGAAGEFYPISAGYSSDVKAADAWNTRV